MDIINNVLDWSGNNDYKFTFVFWSGVQTLLAIIYLFIIPMSNIAYSTVWVSADNMFVIKSTQMGFNFGMLIIVLALYIRDVRTRINEST